VGATLGADPGSRTGALAIVRQGALLDVIDMPSLIVPVKRRAKQGKMKGKLVTVETRKPDYKGMAAWISTMGMRYQIEYAAVEQVQAMPDQGASSGFNFGESYGAILGVLAGMFIETTVYRPTMWKPALGLSSDKALSLDLARTTWPDWAVPTFRYKKHDGRAEAALLARYHEGRS
jgi:Holliday junction resolvasome RuvABC endonuclease subunit